MSIPLRFRESVPGTSEIPTHNAPREAVMPESSMPCPARTTAGTVTPMVMRNP